MSKLSASFGPFYYFDDIFEIEGDCTIIEGESPTYDNPGSGDEIDDLTADLTVIFTDEDGSNTGWLDHAVASFNQTLVDLLIEKSLKGMDSYRISDVAGYFKGRFQKELEDEIFQSAPDFEYEESYEHE